MGLLDRYIAKVEKKYLTKALIQNNGDMTEIAKLIGISRESLYVKVNKYGLIPNNYRPNQTIKTNRKMDKIHAQTLRDVMKKSIEREKSTSEKIESIRLIAESEMKKLDKRVFLKTEWRGSGEIKARDLVEFVYKKAGFPKEFVSRKTEYITHRYAIMYYLVRHRGMKLKNTGSIFGGIDHSTVLHGVNKFKGWIDVNDGEARDILQKVIRAANEFEDVEKLG